MKNNTITHGVFLKTAALFGFLCLPLFSTLAFGAVGDDAKLRELEQAMKASSPVDGNLVKKPRTRAIVFDNEPSAAAQNTTQATAPQPSPQVVAGNQGIDCSKISPDAKTTAVDFVINFKVNSADIASSSESLLQQIAKILALSPDRCVLVEGHTDASGNYEKNLALSQNRADSVARFIVMKAGIDGKRLIPLGKGPSEPMKNTDPRDPKNRRVVFKVVD